MANKGYMAYTLLIGRLSLTRFWYVDLQKGAKIRSDGTMLDCMLCWSFTFIVLVVDLDNEYS